MASSVDRVFRLTVLRQARVIDIVHQPGINGMTKRRRP